MENKEFIEFYKSMGYSEQEAWIQLCIDLELSRNHTDSNDEEFDSNKPFEFYSAYEDIGGYSSNNLAED